MPLLTKSKYLIGLQCPKYLWVLFHQPEIIPDSDDTALYRFDEGTLVGQLATKIFPKGIDLSGLEFADNLKKTQIALKKDKPIFEAGLLVDECFCRVDILVPVGDEWDIVEVKSSTRIKDVNLHDVSFQKFCCDGAGLKIRNCYLMHINNQYVRKGKINPEELFVKEDITAEVNELLSSVPENVSIMFEVINSKNRPDTRIGVQCSAPYDCPIEECWDFLPDNHVFELYRCGKKAFDLVENGVHAIKDIPEDFKLTNHQQLQKKCEESGKPHIDKENIKAFLETLEYPLYYLDFETFNTAIPLLNDIKPYQQIPFQFSLHIVENEKSEPKHISFLSADNKDPRKAFITSLIKSLGTKGSIIVYNQSFEIKILRELAELFPEHQKWFEETTDRIKDLLIPFRNFHYYNPKQKGSASIKKVLPALTNKSYDNLEINNGGSASLAFLNANFENKLTDEQKAQVHKNLEKYCHLDTEAMILIIQKLKEMVY